MLYRADETQTGHILGAAGQRGKDALPERQLSAAECALTRFFTHAVLYLGAMNPAQVSIFASLQNFIYSLATVDCGLVAASC